MRRSHRPRQPMIVLGLALALALPVAGCSDNADEPPADDDGPSGADPGPQLPAIIPSDWLEGIGGEIAHLKQYVSGPLDGTECTELFTVQGVNVTSVQPHDCAQCDVVYETFITPQDGADCQGRDDLADQGFLGMDLRQDSGDAVLWWYVEGWFGGEWTELASGSLAQDAANLELDFSSSFDDPDNGQWAGNFTFEDPCAAWPLNQICSWNGFYDLSLSLAFQDLGDPAR